MSDFKWITIDYFGVSASGKTKIWTVRTISGNYKLGEVRWFAPWRRYAFYPEQCVFEEDCLRDIAAFIETVTDEHKLKLSQPPVKMK